MTGKDEFRAFSKAFRDATGINLTIRTLLPRRFRAPTSHTTLCATQVVELPEFALIIPDSSARALGKLRVLKNASRFVSKLPTRQRTLGRDCGDVRGEDRK